MLIPLKSKFKNNYDNYHKILGKNVHDFIKYVAYIKVEKLMINFPNRNPFFFIIRKGNGP